MIWDLLIQLKTQQGMLKGICWNRPALPRNIARYSGDIVLRFLQSLPRSKEFSLKWWTLKTVTLIALLSEHQCQSVNSLSLFRPYGYKFRESGFFCVPKMFKSTTQAPYSKTIDLKACEPDESICPVRTVVEYIKATEQYRKSQNLILNCYKCGPVTTQMVCGYVKQTLKVAGINTTIFSAHSTRHSTSSKTFMKGVFLKDIWKKEGWKSASLFTRFYNLPILDSNT